VFRRPMGSGEGFANTNFSYIHSWGPLLTFASKPLGVKRGQVKYRYPPLLGFSRRRQSGSDSGRQAFPGTLHTRSGASNRYHTTHFITMDMRVKEGGGGEMLVHVRTMMTPHFPVTSRNIWSSSVMREVSEGESLQFSQDNGSLGPCCPVRHTNSRQNTSLWSHEVLKKGRHSFLHPFNHYTL
jgi:hypothetical protein